MESLFTYCAVIGGIVFVGQILMTFVGFEGGDTDLDIPDTDIDFDLPDTDADGGFESGGHHDGWFVGIISLRSIIAAITIFGLAGKAAGDSFSPSMTLLIAFLSGAVVLYLVGLTFKQLYKIQSDGSVKIEDAIGCSGTVYLKIPAEESASGKVTIKVKNRTMEYLAVTEGQEIPTGAPILVKDIVSNSTVEVVRAT